MDYGELYQYLPSRRIGILVAVILGVFVLFVGVRNRQAISSLFIGADKQATSSRIAALKKTDTDNDGLSDWQENLWGTQKDNPDTDGDGTQDGQEVENNRDPTIAGKKQDSLTPLEKENIESGSRQGVNTNKTDQLFRKILPSAVVVASKRQKGKGVELSRKQIQEIKKQTRKSITINEEDKPYSPKDITTLKSTKQTRRRYSQQLFSHLKSIPQKDLGDELVLFAKAAKGQNPKQKYQKMKKIAQAYTDMNQKLLNMKVPRNFRDEHTKVVNNYHLIALSIEEMTRVEEDPVRALTAIQRYRKLVEKNAQIFYQIGRQLNKDLQY